MEAVGSCSSNLAEAVKRCGHVVNAGRTRVSTADTSGRQRIGAGSLTGNGAQRTTQTLGEGNMHHETQEEKLPSTGNPLPGLRQNSAQAAAAVAALFGYVLVIVVYIYICTYYATN